MYQIFERLIKEKGVTAYRVSKDTGISQPTFSEWKNGRSKPKIDKLMKLAEYFGVDVAIFLGAENENTINKREKN